jgi:hypothetical protein
MLELSRLRSYGPRIGGLVALAGLTIFFGALILAKGFGLMISFDPTVKLSDVITSLSFILAILALVYSQSKDRRTADQQRLAEARTVLSSGITKLERWTSLSESIFDEMQPTLVQTSEIWNEKDGDVIAARDHLWRELNRIYTGVSTKILDERISTAYIDLYRVSSTLPADYRRTLDELEKLAKEIRVKVLADTEQAVLSFSHKHGERVTAELGNALRAEVSRDRQIFREAEEKLIAPFLQRIVSDVAKTDGELLAKLRRD